MIDHCCCCLISAETDALVCFEHGHVELERNLLRRSIPIASLLHVQYNM